MTRTIVTQDEWLTARRAFMEKEKAFQKARDALAAERQALPWMRVEKDYVFDGPQGQISLADLFGPHSQLIVWHFMFGADWEAGCPSCSFWADQFSPAVAHLAARDDKFAVISSAPIDKLAAYRKRMGWTFDWVSADSNTFNSDFAVTFSEEEQASGEMLYNFNSLPAFGREMPGLSVFFKDEDGAIYRTYSAYARGLDVFNGAYQYLDAVPKGRDESDLPYPMSWVKRHDQY